MRTPDSDAKHGRFVIQQSLVPRLLRIQELFALSRVSCIDTKRIADTTPDVTNTERQTQRDTQMTNTAAGPVAVISSAKSAVRGGTTLFFGSLEDGRFVVTSRFQYEIRTTDRAKAERKFEELCRA